jgi:hypothetical protein
MSPTDGDYESEAKRGMITILINKSTTSGVKSKGPVVGITRRIGAKTGSVKRYKMSTIGANGLPGAMGKNDEIARAMITNEYSCTNEYKIPMVI